MIIMWIELRNVECTATPPRNCRNSASIEYRLNNSNMTPAAVRYGVGEERVLAIFLALEI